MENTENTKKRNRPESGASPGKAVGIKKGRMITYQKHSKTELHLSLLIDDIGVCKESRISVGNGKKLGF